MSCLPPQFVGLEQFVAFWAAESTSARHERRTSSSEAQRRAFYDAISPTIDEIFTYLGERPLEEITGADLMLLRLALAALQVSIAVDVIGQKEPEHALFSRRIKLSKEVDYI